MIYILDHYYAIDHQHFCLILESDKTVDEVIEITSAIEFLFEDLTLDYLELDMNCLLKILTNYFDMDNVKSSFSSETIRTLPLPIGGLYSNISVTSKKYNTNAVIIDLFEARESCCGPDYANLLKKWLPTGNKLDEIKEILISEGLEK